ncbi:MAG: hypothetical protein II523_03905 [Bacteroidales bacterium]|nr:hypothetical protein [Bacteroidales bacterium]
MKRLIYTLFAIAALILSSCSNKVNLYSDEGETTIVYGMLDTNADTNFFKITRSFIGNVNELAPNYAVSNYTYDEIEVTFTGKFQGSNATQTLTLDTISKWVPYDPTSVFYSGCYQTYYYVAKKLIEGEEYEIDVVRKADNVKIYAKVGTINSFSFQKPTPTIPITFTDVTASTATVEWRVPVAPFKSTASYFEVTGYFHYAELQPGATDTAHLVMTWPLGSGREEDLYNTSTNLPYYFVTYTPSALFTFLEYDTYLKNNSPAGVKRWFEKFEFDVSAIGKDLYNYYLITNSSSAIQDVPNYTNVENGMGIVSSRITKSLHVTISERTRKKIIEKFPEYHFIYDPNR